MRLPPLALLIACSQGNPPAPPPAEKPAAVEPAPSAAELQALAAQVDQGKQLFAEHCASCHGDTGQGSEDGPPLVGKTALPLAPRAGAKRDVKFRNGADVYEFVARSMPADDPGTLAPEQYVAILAFVLRVNAVKLPHALEVTNAYAVVLH